MKISIPIYDTRFPGNEARYVAECITSGWVSSKGKFVKEFEERFASFCGCQYGIATSNGTAALHLALATLGISAGDEVIVPALTFIATANAVTYTGAKPVFVDSAPSSWNIDPALIEEKLTSRTRAIIPVHLVGYPCDMDPINEIARKHRLHVIEDAAEAHGAEYKGKRVGSLGDMGCFSFYGNKIITTGEGGMIVTDDPSLAQRARFLRDHAMDQPYYHSEIGFNYRLTNIQAALGVAQLENIQQFLEMKAKIATLYNSFLDRIPGISLHPEAEHTRSVCWIYHVLVEDAFGISRDELASRLLEHGIETRPLFDPLPSLPPYYIAGNSFRVAQELHRKGLGLPSSPNLKEQDIAYICETIGKAAKEKP